MIPLTRFAVLIFVGCFAVARAQTNGTNETDPWNTNYVNWNNTWSWVPWATPNRPTWLPTFWENWWYNYWYAAPNQTTYWDTFDTTSTLLTSSFDDRYFGSEENGLTAIKITSNHYRQKKTLTEGEWLAFLTPVLKPPVSIRLTVQLQGDLISKSTRTVAECIQYDKSGLATLQPGVFPCKVNSSDDKLYNDCTEGESSCDLLIEEGDWNGRSVISQHLKSIPDCSLPDWYNNSCVVETNKNSSAWRTYRDCSQVFGLDNCQALLPAGDESCGGYPRPRAWVLGLYLDTCVACIGDTTDVEIDIYLSHQEFPWKEATIALNLSYAAYTSDRSELTSWTCERCSPQLQNVTVVTAGTGDSTLAYIGFDPGTRLIYVVFRGTTDISSQTDTSFINWATNLNSVKTTWKSTSCQVHKGFHSAWTSVNSALLTQLYQLMAIHRQADIRVVGHSLGGALATLFSLNLKSLTWPDASISRPDLVPLAQRKIQVITFGQPRVGDSCFAGLYAASGLDLWRVVNNADGVPTLPSRTSGFQHVGTEIFFYQPGTSQYMVCFSNKTAEDEECRLSVTAPSINDHLNYMNVSLKEMNLTTNFDQPLWQCNATSTYSRPFPWLILVGVPLIAAAVIGIGVTLCVRFCCCRERCSTAKEKKRLRRNSSTWDLEGGPGDAPYLLNPYDKSMDSTSAASSDDDEHSSSSQTPYDETSSEGSQDDVTQSKQSVRATLGNGASDHSDTQSQSQSQSQSHSQSKQSIQATDGSQSQSQSSSHSSSKSS